MVARFTHVKANDVRARWSCQCRTRAYKKLVVTGRETLHLQMRSQCNFCDVVLRLGISCLKYLVHFGLSWMSFPVSFAGIDCY